MNYAITHSKSIRFNSNKDLTFEGKTYQILKKFVKNDTLNVFYLRNHKQEELRNNLFSIIESQDSDGTGNDSPAKQMVNSFLKNYIPYDGAPLAEYCRDLAADVRTTTASTDKIVVAPYLSLFSPPPERA